jgi:hypothetical protein
MVGLPDFGVASFFLGGGRCIPPLLYRMLLCVLCKMWPQTALARSTAASWPPPRLPPRLTWRLCGSCCRPTPAPRRGTARSRRSSGRPSGRGTGRWRTSSRVTFRDATPSDPTPLSLSLYLFLLLLALQCPDFQMNLNFYFIYLLTCDALLRPSCLTCIPNPKSRTRVPRLVTDLHYVLAIK